MKSRIPYTWLFVLFVFLAAFGILFRLAKQECASMNLSEATNWDFEYISNLTADERGVRPSPDSEMLAFVGHHEGKAQVYVMDLASQTISNVSASLDDDTHNAQWSPNSRYLTYEQRFGSGGAWNQLYAWDRLNNSIIPISYSGYNWARVRGFIGENEVLYSLDLDRRPYVFSRNLETGENRLLAGNQWLSSISPNGEWLIFDNADSREYTLYNPQSTVKVSLGWSYDVRWSPDGRWLGVFNTGSMNTELIMSLINLETLERQHISFEDCRYCNRIAWSVDGRFIAGVKYASERAEDGTISGAGYIWVYDVLNQSNRLVAEINHGIGNLSWSPRANHLLFTTNSGVYVTNVDEAITHNFFYGSYIVMSAAWSPNGQYVGVFAHNGNITFPDINSEVWVFDIRDGELYSAPRGWLDGSWYDANLQWSSDNRLFFSSTANEAETGYDVVALSPVPEANRDNAGCS